MEAIENAHNIKRKEKKETEIEGIKRNSLDKALIKEN